MRLLIAKVSHETNTFSPVPTPAARFCPDGETLLTGQAAIDFYKGTTSCLGRYIAIAEELGAEITLPVAAAAPPSGPVDDDAFDLFCGLITDELKQQPFDAIMLDLHGAMVDLWKHEDAEGELLRRVREVAPGTKLSVSLDMHANIFDGIVVARGRDRRLSDLSACRSPADRRACRPHSGPRDAWRSEPR